ncbi:restriction endonuclease subunit S [Rufibacter immobilis]|uniref:Restriction endonuclease subunit S n=1 Tax=Rufibacter immobilis TaxID=1348778 RepID=A0A3M9MPC4_9BACT|nr:restriction endonuclease subunit S [Rufibacter immobilis]RNI27384.1 restriction endonuclease subunit S [Rufibacter immobilis]
MVLLEQFEQLTGHPKNAAKLKELVLQLAVQGKLTEAWRNQHPNVEPASELLKRVLAEKAKLVKGKKFKTTNSISISVEDEKYNMPTSWASCMLDELGIVNPRNQVDDDTRVSFIPMTLVSEKYGITPVFEERSWKEVKSGFTHVAENDVALAKITPCFENSKAGVFKGLINGFGAATTELHVFRSISKEVLPEYIYILFKSPKFLEDGKLNMRGAAGQKRVPTEFVKCYPVPLPPLAEQEAIVARVEELMQKIEELEKGALERIQLQKSLGEAALQALTTAPADELEQQWLFLKEHFHLLFTQEANVKKLREAILQLAVQGKLTSAWRQQNPTVQPAAQLLQQIQAQKAQLVKEKKIKKEKPLEPIAESEVPYVLPEGWVWCRMNDISQFENGDRSSNYPSGVDIKAEGIPFFSTKNIKNKLVNFSNLDFITPAKFESLRSGKAQDNDILFVLRGSVGKVGLFKANEQYKKGFINAQIIIIRNYLSEIVSYCMTYLTSSLFSELLIDKSSGSAQQQLSAGNLKFILFPLPPLAEQEAIVAKVDQLMQMCEALENQLKQSNQQSEALMQAVVHAALQPQEEPVLEA